MTNRLRAALSKFNSARKNLTIERVGRIYSMLCVSGYIMLMMADPAVR